MSNKLHQDAGSIENHVIVIGAGMVGVSTAISLQREGCSVTLLDKAGAEDRASYGNAGVLASSSVVPVTLPGLVKKAPGMVFSKSEPIFLRWSYLFKLMPWAVRYMAHANENDARRIAAALTPIIGNSLNDHRELAAGTGAEKHIRPCDFAVLFKDKKTFLNDTFPWDVRRSNGFSWTERENSELRSYDSVFNPEFDFMATFDGHGQITDPGAYLKDLTKYFVDQGGTLLLEDATDIVHEAGSVTAVKTKTALLPTSKVAITAGAWSPLLTEKLGVNIPVEAESGYHVEYWGANKIPKCPTLVPSGKFILTPMEGRLRVAGAVEFGGLKNQGSKEPLELLRSGLKKLIPGFTYDEEKQWMGHRPAPTDSIPVIDEVTAVKGVFVGFGHQHVGLTGSARTGELLAALILGKTPDIDIAPYKIDRFTKLSAARAVKNMLTNHLRGVA